MKALHCLAPLVFLGLVSPASAQPQPRSLPMGTASSITLYGTSTGRLCFEAALMRRPGSESLDICNTALSELMSQHDTVATYVNRGIVKMLGGDRAGAIEDYDRAIALDPDQADAYLNKGMAILPSDKDGAASVALFTMALDKGTQRQAIAHYGRGIANELAGNVRAAYDDYVQASTLEPNWEDPKTELTRFKVVPRAGGSGSGGAA